MTSSCIAIAIRVADEQEQSGLRATSCGSGQPDVKTSTMKTLGDDDELIASPAGVILSEPELRILAEGDLPTGQHWLLPAGGTQADFATFLETVYADDRRDSGGMAGPPLYPGSQMNTYTGGSGQGLRRVLVRADPRVTRVPLQVASGGHLELAPLATVSDPDLTFFAVLLPQDVGLVSLTALDSDGQGIQADDLSDHEKHWQRFLGRQPPTP
jgi:hypothetical protein